MSGSGSSNNSQSVSKPLTAAERQDLYNSSVGSINNTLNQSPQDYQDSTPATFNSAPNGGGAGTFQASGSVSRPGNSTVLAGFGFGPSRNPVVNMPTGTPDQGGIRVPTYNAPTYQNAGTAMQLANGDYKALQDKMLSGYTSALDFAKATDTENANSGLAARGLWSSGLAEKAIDQDVNKTYASQYAKAGADAANAATGYQLADNQAVNTFNLAGAKNANDFNVTNATNKNTSEWAPLQYLKSLWDSTGGQTSGSSSLGWSTSGGVIGGGKA